MVNNELKDEDVVSFYDYDQQAFLLAHDLDWRRPLAASILNRVDSTSSS